MARPAVPPWRWQPRLVRIVGASATPRGDLGLAAAVLGFAGLLWWQSLAIPPPFFDPLGSAALPQAMASVLAVLALLMAARAAAALTPARTIETVGHRLRPDIAVGIFLLCVGYVGVMDLGWLGFEAATTLFLAAAAALLGRLHLPTLLIGSAVALVMAFGAGWLFTRFFFIDLPR